MRSFSGSMWIHPRPTDDSPGPTVSIRTRLFYVTHLYLVHAIALAAGLAQGFPGSAMRTIHFQLPETYGFGLPVVYLAWLGVVAALYPLCRRYAELRARSRAWWLSDL
jgi:hypothetical protein